MNYFQTVTSIPNNFNMVNPVQRLSNNTCKISFNYFNTGSSGNVYWGSERPMDEKPLTNFKNHSGKPIHSIWNNSTKRKTIVNIK
jgi:hypothetical protein